MSKTKHTHGPWQVNVYSHGDGAARFSVEFEGKSKIAQVFVGPEVLFDEIAEANANLIAAAPEMLRECKFALEMLRAEERSSVIASAGYRNFIHRLECVIAKATGGAK